MKSLVEELKSQGIDPWFDEEDIPKASLWRNELLLGVQRYFDFLFLISPDSIKSEFCLLELEEALRLNKRIIPALVRSIDGFEERLHPTLAALNWLRFDLDALKANRDLIKLINSPRGWMGDLVERPSAFLQIHYYDGSLLDFPLIQNCYWIGRRPAPPRGKAGAIAIPDPNPQAPITSRFHAEIRVVDNKWLVFNRSKNNIALYPQSPKGELKHGTKVFIGHSWLTYYEISFQPDKYEDDNDKDTLIDKQD